MSLPPTDMTALLYHFDRCLEPDVATRTCLGINVLISRSCQRLENVVMGRHIHLQPLLPRDELERRYRAAKDSHEHVWWQVLWLLAQRYNEQGPAGMRNRQCTRSRRTTPLLSTEQQEALRQALAGPVPEEDRWSGRTVAERMSVRLGRAVSARLYPNAQTRQGEIG
jgi:hypothetical protein